MARFEDAQDIARRVVETHKPEIAELDQDYAKTGKVCYSHGMGYPPEWPCETLVLAAAVLGLPPSHFAALDGDQNSDGSGADR